MKARIAFGRVEVMTDLSRPISLAMPVEFLGSEPRHFGAPLPQSTPLAAPGFTGAVTTGASCNCSTITLTPHCNGTHTECAGHLTTDPLQAWQVIPAGLLPALLVTVVLVEATQSRDSSDPEPRSGDLLIDRRSLESRWPQGMPVDPRAIVIRTLPVQAPAPTYLSREAAIFLVERCIEHLVVELPSIDRGEDLGRLTAHRHFFGLPPGSRSLTEASRRHCTVTELALVPADLPDGFYLLELQAPAIAGDAVPSRPLLYPVQRGAKR